MRSELFQRFVQYNFGFWNACLYLLLIKFRYVLLLVKDEFQFWTNDIKPKFEACHEILVL